MCIPLDKDSRSNPIFLKLGSESLRTNHGETHQINRSHDNRHQLEGGAPSDRLRIQDKKIPNDSLYTITSLILCYIVLGFFAIRMNMQLNDLKLNSGNLRAKMHELIQDRRWYHDDVLVEMMNNSSQDKTADLSTGNNPTGISFER